MCAMSAFSYSPATSVAEAVAELSAHPRGTKLLAGGTDLLPLLKDGLLAPTRLINLTPAASSLRYMRFEDNGDVRLGALTTLAQIEHSGEVAARFPALVEAVRVSATPQLRAMATIGGNLLQRNRCWYFRGPFECWLKGGETCYAREGENKYMAIFDQGPCVAVHPSDPAVALTALDAEVTIAGPSATRIWPITDLLAPPTASERVEYRLSPVEVITDIHIPSQPKEARGAYIKVMDRQAWAFALVSVAAQLVISDGRVRHARIALGGVANVPWRAREAEVLLEGQPLTPELATQAGERAVAGAQPLAHNGYKIAMAREIVRRAILQAAGQAGA